MEQILSLPVFPPYAYGWTASSGIEPEWCDGNHIILETLDDDQQLPNFKTRKWTVMELCKELAPTIQHQTTCFWKPIPVHKQMAIALRMLATPDSYHSVANQVRVEKSTVRAVVVQIFQAINTVIYPCVVTIA